MQGQLGLAPPLLAEEQDQEHRPAEEGGDRADRRPRVEEAYREARGKIAEREEAGASKKAERNELPRITADEAPEDYFTPDDLVAVHRATALFRQSLDDLTLVSMDEALVNFPVFLGGFTPSGLFAGVFAVRCDT